MEDELVEEAVQLIVYLDSKQQYKHSDTIIKLLNSNLSKDAYISRLEALLDALYLRIDKLDHLH